MRPAVLLNQQLEFRQSKSIEDRQWLLNLVLQHTRDNVDFADYTPVRKYDIFAAIKSFFDYNEVPLTMAKNVYGRARPIKKNRRKQIDITEAKKILGGLSQRNRTICLIQLQSGIGGWCCSKQIQL